MSADHPVFTRLTRQQRIIRRRTLGFQTLVFSLAPNPLLRHSTSDANDANDANDASDATEMPGTQCKVCARWFETYWKPFLCHVCGLWVCEPCSSVVEREREHNRITFVRCCADCLRVFNRWMPDPDALADVAFSPMVVSPATAAAALGFNMAEVMRGKREWRRAVVDLLRRFGRPVGSSRDAIDEVSEDDWLCTAVDAAQFNEISHRHSCSGPHVSLTEAAAIPNLAERWDSRAFAQFIIQQCYEVTLKPMSVSECRFAEDDGTRGYSLQYDYVRGISTPPPVPHEAERVQWVQQSNVLESDNKLNLVQLICFLASKELRCKSTISVMVEDEHFLLAMREGDEIQTLRRATSMLTFSSGYDTPFLVRNSRMDVRFRRLPLPMAADGVVFLLAFPIRDALGRPVAQFLAFDTQPRRCITTTEYAVMRTLADVAGQVLQEGGAAMN